MPGSTSTSTDLATKLLLAAIVALLSLVASIGGLVGWYVVELTEDIDEMRAEQSRQGRSLAILAGDNPYDEEATP